MDDPKEPKRPFILDMSIPDREPASPVPTTPPDSADQAAVRRKLAWDQAAGKNGPAWKVGDRVLAPWEPMFLYVGTIQELQGFRALIQFDDGDAGWVALDDLQAVSVKVGQQVLSRRKMGPLFYPATITKIADDEVLVEFEDGARTEWTKIASLRIIADREYDGAEPTTVASNKAYIEQLRNGDRVWAHWMNGAMFVGRIRELNRGRALVLFDDGDEGWVLVEQLLPYDPASGMRVLANHKKAGTYYPGVITQVSGERVHINYDDGDHEWVMPNALVITFENPGPNATPTKVVTGGGGGWGYLWIAGLVVFFAFKVFAMSSCR
ncbi:MAG: hypothetical protein EXS16_06240 [Gemmataceae bacterium]|nr:hypothetical protein [Gemmataceae bacterium]